MKNFNSIMYMYSDMDKSSQLLLFLIVLVSLMLVCIFIINIITRKKNAERYMSELSSKKMKSLKRKINDANEDIRPSVSLNSKNRVKISNTKLEVKDKEKNISKISENKEDKKIEKQEFKKSEEKHEKIKNVPEIEQIEEILDEEIKPKKKEIIEEVRVSKRSTSLDDITKLMEDTLESEPINLTKFEEDQEENAIISYDELVKRAGAKKIIYRCEDEKVPVKTIEKEASKPKTENMQVNDKPKAYSEHKKFQASKVISPIFGIQKDEEVKDEVLESFIDLEDFNISKSNTRAENTEEEKDSNFLSSLKEFRSGLE